MKDMYTFEFIDDLQEMKQRIWIYELVLDELEY